MTRSREYSHDIQNDFRETVYSYTNFQLSIITADIAQGYSVSLVRKSPRVQISLLALTITGLERLD